jgi:type IV secretion system protein VirB9
VTHVYLACLLAVSATVLTTELWAEVVPPPGAADARVRVVPYAPDQVYRLLGSVGYAIHIELEDGEEYVGLGTGDGQAITVDVSQNNVFLKPRALLVQTNLTLLTTRRRYHFDYSVGAGPRVPAVGDMIYSLRFTYPQMPSTELSRDTETSARARPRNTDYWYCGHPSLRPESTFDDGVQTHILFSSTGEIPALFVRNQDGSESLLNFSIDSDTGEVVIHRLASTFVLRRGRITGCIVNRSYSGSGERLPSGTVAPDVSREIRGARP